MSLRFPTDARSLERDTVVEVYKGGGPGGQHRNKTENAVRLYHRPSGVRVTATERRSLHANLDAAFERLHRALERLNTVVPPRVATRVPPRERRKRIDEKARSGERKRSRAAVRDRE